MKKIPPLLLLCLVNSLVHTNALAQAKSPTGPSTNAATSTAQASSPNPYALRAQNNGATQCVARINQITGFVSGNLPNAGMMFFPATTNQSNQKILAASIEVLGSQNTSTLVSTHFAPGKENGECSGSYDAVTFFPQSCEQIAKSNFSTFKITGQALQKNIAILDGGPYAKVYLMPAGTAGCIAIKKEVVY